MGKWNSALFNQAFVVSGVLCTILSCGLGLGYLTAFSDNTLLAEIEGKVHNDTSLRYIETVGELAFVPSIVIIPLAMQKKGRRIANIMTSIPLLFSWIISYDANNFTSLITFNILHNVALGGAVAISSVVIAEFCCPRYRSMFLMLETAMLSLGVLISHIAGMFNCWKTVSVLGAISSMMSLTLVYYWPESPYWLISQGHIVKGTDTFYWLRGKDPDSEKELQALILTYRIQYQLEALKPIRKLGFKSATMDYAKSLLKADFLKPLSIMILLFSFIGFGGENIVTNYSFRYLFRLTNGKYIGTIILDVFTLVCSLTACVLVQIVKRKTLFLFTGSFSIVFLALTSLLLFVQTFELFSRDYMWLFLSFVTGFVMFMSLGTSALPFSMLGEIFPMTYKGIGSSLTCAYLWAFGNSMLKFMPKLTDYLGLQGVVFLIMCFMILILLLINKIMPETNAKTLSEIEDLMKLVRPNVCDNTYDVIQVEKRNSTDNFDNLKLFIEV